MDKKIIAGEIVAIAFVIASFITVGYPYFFRGSLADPSVDMDSKEDKVWLDSQIVMEFRGSHSKEALLETLEISPKVKIGQDDLKVEHVAFFPWHEGFPWAKTRVAVNSERAELFEPETSYTVSIRDKELKFETITLPKVVDAYKSSVPPRDFKDVPTSDQIVFVFNEEVDWQDEYLEIEPPTDITTSVEVTLNNEAELRVIPTQRWENSTTYTLTLRKGLKDTYGHEGRQDFSLDFTTWPPPKVVESSPSGESLPLDSAVRVKFDRQADQGSVEEAFKINPVATGTFEWENDWVLVWRPADLAYSTAYTVSVAGEGIGGDPVIPHEWQFRTADPPVSVKIESGSSSKATLKAIASGGLGRYFYKWSTGETSDSISVKVPAGETWNISVTVSSGDQTATAEALVKGPPLPPPPPAPAPEPPAPTPAPPPPPTVGGGMKFVLSFDDSDGSGATVSGILDTLARYGAKAIFFPKGSWAAGAGAPYVQRMLSEGHMVCNHTRDHANLTTLSEAGIREQILGGADGGSCSLLRPPYGAHNAFVDSVAASMGYSIYMWTVDPRDWSGTSVSYITSTILSNASPGGIVVLHMHAGNTLLALPAIIEGLQAAGYTLSY